ncbi:MAG: copper homeostasis protein CutC [Sphaerochaeta sp.]
MNTDGITIEICLDSVESIINAEKGGASRVEFCSDLFEGGLTPTLGAFRVAKEHASIPMNVMIRPRGGDFCYSDLEFMTMLSDAEIFREAGANALVFGILTPEGRIDTERSARFLEVAQGLPVTFHRAFDMTRDPYEAMEDLIALGVDRVLTSGQEATVPEGLDLLSDLMDRYGKQIVIMPGSGITERNFPRIHQQLQAKEYHMYLHSPVSSAMRYRPDHIYMGGLLRQEEFLLQHTDQGRVASMVGSLKP